MDQPDTRCKECGKTEKEFTPPAEFLLGFPIHYCDAMPPPGVIVFGDPGRIKGPLKA